MLTKNEKRSLENRIYNAIKKGLKEQQDKLTRDQIIEMHMFNSIHESKGEESKKLHQITKWLDDPSVDKAQVAYKLTKVKAEGGDNNEKKNARSLFLKKLHKEPLPSGDGNYSFNTQEINDLFSLMTNQSY